MPIKAKRVDAERAAQVARGQLSGGNQTGKNYFYYEHVKKRDLRERDGDRTSSSSNESSRAGSPKPELRESRTTSSSTAAATKMSTSAKSDADSDEEFLAAARERTRRFLCPESEKNYVAAPYHNERAEAYARFRENQQERQVSETDGALSVTHAAPSSSHAQSVPVRRTPSSEAELVGAPHQERKAPSRSTLVGEPVSADGDHDDDQSDSDDGNNNHDDATPRPAPFDASSTSDAQKSDFYKLLNLIGKDVEREWSHRLATQDAAANGPNGATAATTTAAHPSATQPSTYRPPAQNFADLQDDALQQLYEQWSADHEDDDTAVFVASDHTAEAFTRAVAMSAARSRTADLFNLADRAPTRLSGAPLTLEELALTNAMMLSGHAGTTSARTIASEAHRQLNRFLSAVAWIERLVRDRRFIASAGAFLHVHHKPFMRYLAIAAEPASSLTEHDHQEFAVYQQFGSQFSDMLLRLLSDKVEGFDEAEFVEALYETPVSARTQFAASHRTHAGGLTGESSSGPENVLSYPAWRIILAMSSFESFFDWMMDYVREEYNVSALDEAADQVVAVGGARGVRALLRSTYGDGALGTSTREKASPLAQTAGTTVENDADASSCTRLDEATAPAALTSASGSLLSRAQLSPSPPPVSLHPLPRPDSSPPYASSTASAPVVAEAANSVPPKSHLPCKFFPTPPASADGRVKQSSQRARLGQRLPPLTVKTLPTETAAGAMLADADVGAKASTDPPRKRSTTTTDSASTATRSKSGAKRTASQTKRMTSSAGSENPGVTSQRSSAVDSSAGSASAGGHISTAARSASKPRRTSRAPSQTKMVGGTKPKLRRTPPP